MRGLDQEKFKFRDLNARQFAAIGAIVFSGVSFVAGICQGSASNGENYRPTIEFTRPWTWESTAVAEIAERLIPDPETPPTTTIEQE